MNVLFVCTGNTCRSVLAEFIFKKMAGSDGIEVRSAGIAANPNFPMPSIVTRILEEEGAAPVNHTPSLLEASHIHWADKVLAMERSHKEVVLTRFPEAASKVYLLKEFALEQSARNPDIADPIGAPDAVYRECLAEIKVALAGLRARLTGTEP